MDTAVQHSALLLNILQSYRNMSPATEKKSECTISSLQCNKAIGDLDIPIKLIKE